ncbi:uncharacterized protein LODBEIA_P39310 [Lodderomyces beijingensis]|uniref:Uncharacterized protein n=1 Tax=Lodderomyces beijingensis TaxID=1775926 RepID=A0ABP0ZTW4_9ASCO
MPPRVFTTPDKSQVELLGLLPAAQMGIPIYDDHVDVSDEEFHNIKDAVIKAKGRAYCPYSKFRYAIKWNPRPLQFTDKPLTETLESHARF